MRLPRHTVVVGPRPGRSLPNRRCSPGARLRTLLYVEDNPANLSLVEQLVARCSDMRLLSARNGNLGIQIARDSLPERDPDGHQPAWTRAVSTR